GHPQGRTADRAGCPSYDGAVALCEDQLDDLAGVLRVRFKLDGSDELSGGSAEARRGASPRCVGGMLRLLGLLCRYWRRPFGGDWKRCDTHRSCWSLGEASQHEPAPVVWDRLRELLAREAARRALGDLLVAPERGSQRLPRGFLEPGLDGGRPVRPSPSHWVPERHQRVPSGSAQRRPQTSLFCRRGCVRLHGGCIQGDEPRVDRFPPGDN